MSSPPAPEELLGKKVGGCLLQKVLRVDASYALFGAKHVGLQRPSLVQVLLPTLAVDPEVVARFKQAALDVGGVRNVSEEAGVHFAELGGPPKGWPDLTATTD